MELIFTYMPPVCMIYLYTYSNGSLYDLSAWKVSPILLAYNTSHVGYYLQSFLRHPFPHIHAL